MTQGARVFEERTFADLPSTLSCDHKQDSKTAGLCAQDEAAQRPMGAGKRHAVQVEPGLWFHLASFQSLIPALVHRSRLRGQPQGRIGCAVETRRRGWRRLTGAKSRHGA